MQYGMVIDLKGCVGCQLCVMECKTAHNMPKGLFRNQVHTVGGDVRDTPSGTFPNVSMSYLPTTCQHCCSPKCVEVCPTGATWKDEETGIVRQNSTKCIGCGSCVAACPYEGVRMLGEGEPVYLIDSTLGYSDEPPYEANTIAKCDLCSNRIAQGETPACMEYCIGHVRFYGDLDDPNSEVSKLIASREYMQLLPDEGTDPSIYYLV